jgi:hypothetical protein
MCNIGRLLDKAMGTLLRKLLRMAAAIAKPPVPLKRPAFEIVELRTHMSCILAGKGGIGHFFRSSNFGQRSLKRPVPFAWNRPVLIAIFINVQSPAFR